MNLWQEGYDRGFADGKSGLPSQSVKSFGLTQPVAITHMLETGFPDYEAGYDEGYLKGEDAHRKLQEKKS